MSSIFRRFFFCRKINTAMGESLPQFVKLFLCWFANSVCAKCKKCAKNNSFTHYLVTRTLQFWKNQPKMFRSYFFSACLPILCYFPRLHCSHVSSRSHSTTFYWIKTVRKKNLEFCFLYPNADRPKLPKGSLIFTSLGIQSLILQNYKLEFFHQGIYLLTVFYL